MVEPVTVKYKPPDPTNAAPGGGPITASQLAVPEKAQEEMHKGALALQKKRYEEVPPSTLAALVVLSKDMPRP